MRYKCYDCGAIFDEEDAETYQESRGEFWGAPCYETLMCCPECRSDDIDEYNEEDEEEEEEILTSSNIQNGTYSRFTDLPIWAQKMVIADIQKVFPELNDPDMLNSYLSDKSDFRIVNIAEDDETPEWQVEW